MTMTVRLAYKHPAGPDKVREFPTKKDAATYGIAYYLADNGYATRKTAGMAASVFLETGETACDGIEFWTEETA